MQAAVVSAQGQPPRYQSFQEPVPGEGEVMVHVRAAGLHPIVKSIASGSHYLATDGLPMVPGIDGVGVLEDGSRVFFGFARRPWGTMAERAVVPRERCIPIPDGLSDTIAAALPNPGMSAWLSLKERAEMAAGESVLISGATGVGGRIAIQVARHLGAKRIIGAGRNAPSLEGTGLDAIVDLTRADDQVREAFAVEARKGIDVIIDYLWGRPTELLLEALSDGLMQSAARPIRLVEVGDTAGKRISMAGAVLRSVNLKMLGSGFGSVSMERILRAFPTLFSLAVQGELSVEVEPTPLSDVEAAWSRKTGGRRIVFTV